MKNVAGDNHADVIPVAACDHCHALPPCAGQRAVPVRRPGGSVGRVRSRSGAGRELKRAGGAAVESLRLSLRPRPMG
jgi:hypothetical protein